MTATTEKERIRRLRQPALLTYAFRPMFLAAGSWAVMAMAIWLAMLSGYPPIADPLRSGGMAYPRNAVRLRDGGGRGVPADGHSELDRTAAGAGTPAGVLASLWLLGRIACLISADLPAWLAITADLSFPVALLAVAAREIVAGRNWRNLPMTAPLGVFIIADLLMHLESLDITCTERPRLAARTGGADPADLGHRRAHHPELHAQLAGQSATARACRRFMERSTTWRSACYAPASFFGRCFPISPPPASFWSSRPS